jgi:putative restriction endonuclease
VSGIESDSRRPDHYYARVRDFLLLDNPVPFREGQHFYERSLERDDGKTNKGAFGRSVRNLSDPEFDAIVARGFSEIPLSEFESAANLTGFGETAAPFIRPLVEIVATRSFRDRAFARQIQKAYDGTCAVTGLRLINGGGRAEVQAAHIRPVAHGGSDSVRNGLALSGTIHWMFDRGLMSVADDYRVLLSSKGVPDQIRALLPPDGRVRLPSDRQVWPHPHFLAYHRQTTFSA